MSEFTLPGFVNFYPQYVFDNKLEFAVRLLACDVQYFVFLGM